jgi:hypothetical protein
MILVPVFRRDSQIILILGELFFKLVAVRIIEALPKIYSEKL